MNRPEIWIADLNHLTPEQQPQTFQALYDTINALRLATELPPGIKAARLNLRMVKLFENLMWLLPSQELLDAKYKDQPPAPPAYLVNGQSVWDRNMHEEFDSLTTTVWELEAPEDNDLLPQVINAVVHMANHFKLSVMVDSMGLGYMPPRIALCAWGEPQDHACMFDPPKFPAPAAHKHPSLLGQIWRVLRAFATQKPVPQKSDQAEANRLSRILRVFLWGALALLLLNLANALYMRYLLWSV